MRTAAAHTDSGREQDHDPIVEPSQHTDYKRRALPGHDPELLKKALNHPGLYRNLEPVEYAVEAILEVESEGLEVRFYSFPYVTHLTCGSEKLEFIRQHLGDRWLPRTILTNDRTFVPRGHPDRRPSGHHRCPHALLEAARFHPYVQTAPRSARITEWRNWREAVFPMLESTFAMR